MLKAARGADICSSSKKKGGGRQQQAQACQIRTGTGAGHHHLSRHKTTPAKRYPAQAAGSLGHAHELLWEACGIHTASGSTLLGAKRSVLHTAGQLAVEQQLIGREIQTRCVGSFTCRLK
jgi:hypothetical protein